MVVRALCIFLFLNLITAGILVSQDIDHSELTVTRNSKELKKEAGSTVNNARKLVLVKFETRNILYGNKCFEEVCAKYGFEYIVQTRGVQPYPNGLVRSFHNLWVNTKLLFKNGPFWKIKLNRKKKECQKLSGDYRG